MFYTRKLPRTQREGSCSSKKKESDHHTSSEKPVPQWDQERPDQLHQDQVPDQRCLHPGAHLHLGFLQSAEIQPRGVSVLVFLRGLRVLWHSCAFADEIFKTCWKIHNLSQDQENQCHQVASRVYVTCEGSGNPNDAKKVLVIVIFKFVSIILTFSSNSELKLL